MMEYRVVYYTESFGGGIGSPHEPWFAYTGNDYAVARDTFNKVRHHLTDEDSDIWTVQLQAREVTEWSTVSGTQRPMSIERDGAVR